MSSLTLFSYLFETLETSTEEIYNMAAPVGTYGNIIRE